MTTGALTILLRELRTQGRRIGTHLMRVAIAVPVFFLCLSDLVSEDPDNSDTLVRTSSILMVLFCFGAGFAVSDVIGSERRRGTLGLLMLTPLRPNQVLLGKASCQATHHLLCLAAVVPVIALPLISGGITWQEVVMQCVNLLAATLLGLSAGLLATTCFRQPWASLSTCLLVLLALFLVPPALRSYYVFVNSIGPDQQGGLWSGLLELPAAASRMSAGTAANPLLDSDWWEHLGPTLLICAVLFVLALSNFRAQWAIERDPSRLPGRERRPEAPRPEPPSWVCPSIRRRRLHLPEGRNPCEELAGAYADNPLGSRMILMILSSVFLSVYLFTRFDGSSNHPLFASFGIDDNHYLFYGGFLILIEVAVRWSLAAEIPRQYGQERNGGTLELVLGSSLSAGQVARGLARATIRTHLWKPGLLVFFHLLVMPEAETITRMRFHLGSLLLICLEAHAIHMVAACLALRGYSQIGITLGLFGVHCLLPLATLFLPPLFLPVPIGTLLDASLVLRLACALTGSLLFLDLRRIRRIFNDPDHRGPIGLLFSRRARTARS